MTIIHSTTGNGHGSSSDDVLSIRKTLDGLGYVDNNLDFGVIDKRLDDNIRRFQKKNSLKNDGVMKPNGETIHKMKDQNKLFDLLRKATKKNQLMLLWELQKKALENMEERRVEEGRS